MSLRFVAPTLLLLLLAPRAAPAAVIDCDYAALRGKPIADALLRVLVLPEDRRWASIRDGLDRVLVSWDGRRSPPLLRFKGVPAVDLLVGLGVDRAVVPTPVGESVMIPWQPGMNLIALSEDEVLVAMSAVLEAWQDSAWPERGSDRLRATILPADMKLGDLADDILGLSLRWDEGDQLRVVASTPDKARAQAVRAYIGRRKAFIHLAAGFGADSAAFASALLRSTDMVRQRGDLILETAMSEELMAATQGELLRLFVKQLGRATKDAAAEAAEEG